MGFREEVASESSGSFGEYGEQAGPGAQSLGRTGTGAVCGQERGLQGRTGLSVKQLSQWLKSDGCVAFEWPLNLSVPLLGCL